VAGTFDHDLDVVLPGAPGQFAERLQLRELRRIGGVVQTAGPQRVAEGEGYVVALEDLADLVEVSVERILLMVIHHPLREDRAPPRETIPVMRPATSGRYRRRMPAWIVM
jgi:hypothetical protein